MSSQSRLALNWSEIAAGAFAALSGAVTASLLGVYGTFLGAAVMSVITTAGTAISHHYMKRARARLGQPRQEGMAPPDNERTSLRTPRWVKFAGGTGLVVASAAATVASMTVVAETPLGEKLFANGDGSGKTKVIVKKVDNNEGGGPGSGTGPGAASQDRGSSGTEQPTVVVTETSPPQAPEQQQDDSDPGQPDGDNPSHTEPTPPTQPTEPPAGGGPGDPDQPSQEAQQQLE